MLSKLLQSLMPVIRIVCIILIALNLAFDALPLVPNNALSTISAIDLQRTLGERIAKDVLILSYRPTSEHVQAVAELQSMLPYWEKVQNGLTGGDESLGISDHLPPDIRLLLVQAQTDYVEMDQAAHTIVAHPSQAVDPIELSIVLQHEPNYFLTMLHVAMLEQQHIQSATQVYFSLEAGIGVLLLASFIALLAGYRAQRKSVEDQGESVEDKENEDQSGD